ncbi:MAG: replication initiation factor domain-containing protein [Actinobacteria bacterium]|nr:replication initiation factor domain-containing protein [Actinomycetota bacterium]
MASSSTVAATQDHDGSQRDLYGWDWSATTHSSERWVREVPRNTVVEQRPITDLLKSLDPYYVLPGKGLQGWARSMTGYDAEGFKLGTVYYGGREDFHVVCTSDAADGGRAAVIDADPAAKTARVDTRVDTLVPYEELVQVCERAASTYGSLVTTMESRQRGESKGRTLYLGAPSSAVRVRVYEKWLQSPGEYPKGTNRVEVQLRPASKVKEKVSGWSAAQTFCASKVTRDLARMLGDDLAPKSSLHVKRGTPDLERTLRVMGEQYGNAVEKWMSLHGAGDADAVHRVMDYLVGAR